MSARWRILWPLLAVLPLLLGVERPRGLGDVRDVRTWSHGEFTRVVVELTRPVEAQVRQLGADRRAGRPARLYVDPPAAVAQIRHEVFEPVNERFREVLSRALPDASPEEVALSLQLGLGVLVHMLSGNAELAGSSENALEDLFDTLVTFSAAGIKAVCCESASGNSRGPIDAGSAGEDS